MTRTGGTLLISFAAIALCSITPVRAQTELRLWPDQAPGSEQWSIPESITRSSAPRGPLPGMPGPGSAPRQELVIVNGNANPAPEDAALAKVLELAVADAQAALALVRTRAGEWRIDPKRVGIIGFSAGGGVAVGTALAPQSEATPDFLVSVYGPSLRATRSMSGRIVCTNGSWRAKSRAK